MVNPPDFLRTKRMTGAGVSKNILDRAVWRKEHEPDDEWVAALDKADRDDTQPLLDLLRSECDLPLIVRYYLADLIERGVKGPQNPPRSRAHGLPDTDPWVTAVDAVGEGNKRPIVDLLRSELALLQLARGYLADLIVRGIAKPPKGGRPRVPLYNRSGVEAVLWLANDDVSHRPRGQTLEAALAAAAERYGQYGVTTDTLRKYRTGRREATNRKRKALPKRG